VLSSVIKWQYTYFIYLHNEYQAYFITGKVKNHVSKQKEIGFHS